MSYEAPRVYTVAESARLAYLLARGGKAAASGKSTARWDREVDELRAAAVERERLEKEAAAKEKAEAEAKRAAEKAKKRAASTWW